MCFSLEGSLDWRNSRLLDFGMCRWSELDGSCLGTLLLSLGYFLFLLQGFVVYLGGNNIFCFVLF